MKTISANDVKKRKPLTDDEVEAEIAELLRDPDVILAKAEAREKNRRRQYMYQLRCMKRRGEQIRNDPDMRWLTEAVEEEYYEEGC